MRARRSAAVFPSAVRLAPLAVTLTVAACDHAPTATSPTPSFRTTKTVTVTTLTEWQVAIASAQVGATIAIDGTIEIAAGDEAILRVHHVTIEAATPASGLRGVAPAPACLVCLGIDANGTTVHGVRLDGVTSFAPIQTPQGTSPASVSGLTFTDNEVHCDGCAVHVFINRSPRAVFAGNVLTGQPTFTAIQVQRSSTRALIKDNWVEFGGPVCGIRAAVESDGVKVVDNTIASTPQRAICAVSGSDGATFRDNKILAVTNGGPSCLDDTSGTGTAGTGNKWEDNVAPVASDPVGICGPKS